MTSCYLCGVEHNDNRLGACDQCRVASENRKELLEEKARASRATGHKFTIASIIIGPALFIIIAAFALQPTPYTVNEGGRSYDLLDAGGTVRYEYDKSNFDRLTVFPIKVTKVRDPFLEGGVAFYLRYVESKELQAEYFESILGKISSSSFLASNARSLPLLVPQDVSVSDVQEILEQQKGVKIGGVYLVPSEREGAAFQRGFLVRSAEIVG